MGGVVRQGEVGRESCTGLQAGRYAAQSTEPTTPCLAPPPSPPGKPTHLMCEGREMRPAWLIINCSRLPTLVTHPPTHPPMPQPARSSTHLMCEGREMRPAWLIICSVWMPSSMVSRERGSGTSWMPLRAARAA